MATRVRTRSSDLYEQDFYAWSREQAALLRAGRYDELDLQHLTEEVEDLGGSLYRSVRWRVRTIMEHLLKLEHSPAAEPRGLWRDTIHAQRADLEDDLTATLRRRLQAELPKQYLRAPAAAARALRRDGETAAADALPASYPSPSIRSPATGCPDRTIVSLRDVLVASSSEPRLEHACRALPAWKIHDRRGQRTLDVPLDLGELCARVLRATAAQAEGSAGP